MIVPHNKGGGWRLLKDTKEKLPAQVRTTAFVSDADQLSPHGPARKRQGKYQQAGHLRDEKDQEDYIDEAPDQCLDESDAQPDDEDGGDDEE